MHNFIYSIIILHHDPQHASSIAVPIFRGTIVYLQYLVSSHSVCCHTVHRSRADCRAGRSCSVHVKEPKVTWKSPLSAKFLGHFSPIVPPSAARFASLASDAGGLLWQKLERSKSLVILQVGGWTCRW
jgi:hypothetical protein